MSYTLIIHLFDENEGILDNTQCLNFTNEKDMQKASELFQKAIDFEKENNEDYYNESIIEKFEDFLRNEHIEYSKAHTLIRNYKY